MNVRRLGLILALLGIERAASAQVFVQSEFAGAFTPIGEIGGLVGPTAFVFDDDDEGEVTLTIPFTFRYAGRPFTSVRLTTNGTIDFGTEFPGYTNYPVGNNSYTDDLIAVWWDDLVVADAALAGAYGVFGTAPNRALVIEVGTWERYPFSNRAEGRWQAWLYEGPTGRFEIRYDGALSAAESYSATAGWAGISGNPSGVFRPCAAACNATDFGTMVGRVFRVEQANEPELVGSIGNFGRGALPGATALIPVALRNPGAQPADAFQNRLWFSRDQVLDPADRPLLTFASPALGPGLQRTVTATVIVPANIGAVDGWLLLQVDSNNAVAEANEANNVSVSPGPFATAPDLSISTIAAPAGVDRGATVRFSATVLNDALPVTGSMLARVYLSPDPIFDVNDPYLGEGTVSLLPQASQVAPLDVVVAGNVPLGYYFPIIRLDATNVIREADESNNNGIGAQRVAVGPDFAVVSLTSPARAVPGQTFNTSVRISSRGAPFSGALSYRLLLSSDSVADANDQVLGLYTVNFAGQATLDDPRTPTYPAVPPAPYRILVELDPARLVGEADETNNTFLGPTVIRGGPDFSLQTVNATPNPMRAGAVLTVGATIRNDGALYSGPLDWQIRLTDFSYAATDPVVLRGRTIMNSALTTVFTATVAVSSFSPPVLPDDYYVYVELDPDNLLDELDEANNRRSTNNRLVLEGANLRVVNLTAANAAYVGTPLRIELTVQNDGVVEAAGWRYAYVFSSDGVVRQGERIYRSVPIALAAGATRTFVDQVPIDPNTPAGDFLVGVIVDLEDSVAELRENDNLGVTASPTRVLMAAPDLVAQLVITPTQAASGESLGVTRIVRNLGAVAASGAEFGYFLSQDATIDARDTRLATVRTDLVAGGELFAVDTVLLPTGLLPGPAYLALVADPDQRIAEGSEANNVVSAPIVLYEAPLSLLTAQLADARVNVPYSAGLYARGGTVPWVWVASGLPPGLSVDAATGIVAGVTSAEGRFEVRVQVTSGPQQVETTLPLWVRPAPAGLGVGTQLLPPGVVGRTYRADLLAQGGAPPYRWRTNRLPEGLTLTSSGALSGVPTARTRDLLVFQVSDVLGVTATATLSLEVLQADALVRIAQIPLPIGALGQDLCAIEPLLLFANGGEPPYQWRLLEGPAGFTLSSNGALCGTPTEVGDTFLVAEVRDRLGFGDTAGFVLRVRSQGDLHIGAGSLPDAVLGQPYTHALAASRGFPPYTWEAEGALPPGLSLADGRLEGTPTTLGEWAFAMRLTDARAETTVMPLSLRVVAASGANAAGEGCGCNELPGARHSPWLVFGLLLCLRRKK